MSQLLIPPFSEKFKLKDYDPQDDGGMERAAGEGEIDTLRARLNELQDLLYADGRYAVLVVLQAIDTGGKDGTIKSVFRDVSPLGVSVENFGVPTKEELAHDYLWRYHRVTPAKGHITIFNRSYYESVLVERVKKIVTEEVWEKRYEQINRFEALLTAEGTVVLKFFLHISNEEQRERLQARIDEPNKRWKFRKGDLEERALWDDYQAAFEDMVARCNTEIAPWHVVPANRKWYRDVVVGRAMVQRLEQLALRYPEPEEGIQRLTVP